MVEVNTQLLISLVEERPVLWDKTIELYKDKGRTFEAWREIFTTLNNNFEKIDNTEKNEYGHLVIKKWTCLRDCWMKCHKRLKTWKPQSGAKKCRKYVYYNEMFFLNKIATRWQPDTNDNPAAPSEVDISEKSGKRKETADASRTKERAVKDARLAEEDKESDTSESEEIDEHTKPKPTIAPAATITEPTIFACPSRESSRMPKFKPVENVEESRAMAFFRSIAPIVDKFSDDDLVDFQFEVIKAVRNITKRNNAPIMDDISVDDPLELKPNISDIHRMHTSF